MGLLGGSNLATVHPTPVIVAPRGVHIMSAAA